ncbi:hypothetical protein [Egibacter rhizosphaerae]|uniref:hypothetical protein n=1 Tax=Egibacter rhizosphaerae TaxID=1670831 RepID=UPI0013F17A7A|nr:hypothetical protein [Egibacter rhizosphaerae]
MIDYHQVGPHRIAGGSTSAVDFPANSLATDLVARHLDDGDPLGGQEGRVRLTMRP